MRQILSQPKRTNYKSCRHGDPGYFCDTEGFNQSEGRPARMKRWRPHSHPMRDLETQHVIFSHMFKEQDRSLPLMSPFLPASPRLASSSFSTTSLFSSFLRPLSRLLNFYKTRLQYCRHQNALATRYFDDGDFENFDCHSSTEWRSLLRLKPYPKS